MKTNINPDLPVELTFTPDFQDSEFTITGLAYDQATQLEAKLAKHNEQRDKVARRAIKAVREPENGSQNVIKSRVAANIKAIMFDKRNGTNLYEQLQEKRRNERIVKAGVELGLISLTDTVCVKHRHAVDALKS